MIKLGFNLCDIIIFNVFEIRIYYGNSSGDFFESDLIPIPDSNSFNFTLEDFDNGGDIDIMLPDDREYN